MKNHSSSQQAFFALDPFNFVPFTRTPWGGGMIPAIKKQSFAERAASVPSLVGESWEVSTDAQFISSIVDEQLTPVTTLIDALSQNPASMLGARLAERFGGHCPLLLKWLHANDVLSVQIHPDHKNPLLRPQECGKPESWLVLDVESHGVIYLGFKDGLSQNEILDCLKSANPERCLHAYKPKPFDYISVPTGCIHAVGPGVLIAEPQFVLPNRAGKTWRLSDWGRRYNQNGERDDVAGVSRELHTEQGSTAIDWSLPRGKQIESTLVHCLATQSRFVGDSYNPFAAEVLTSVGAHTYKQLCVGQFSLLTVWRGDVMLTSANGQTCRVRGGQSAFIAAVAGDVQVQARATNGQVGCAFFAIRPEVL